MRKDKRTYFDFLELFAPAIVGKNKWRANWKLHPFGECLTVSDEAFIILCNENFKLKWIDQVCKSTIPTKVCCCYSSAYCSPQRSLTNVINRLMLLMKRIMLVLPVGKLYVVFLPSFASFLLPTS